MAAVSAKRYRVGLRGERNYQPAIMRSDVGDRLVFVHDEENRYDDRAIVVATIHRELLGYLPRDGWLTGVILDQGHTVHGEIESIADGGTGDLGVVISVWW